MGPGTREGAPGCSCTSVELRAIPELGTFLFHIRKMGQFLPHVPQGITGSLKIPVQVERGCQGELSPVWPLLIIRITLQGNREVTQLPGKALRVNELIVALT